MGLEEEHICAICHQVITGGAMRTKNKIYCEDSCFNCSACQRSLKDVSVFLKDDSLYCEEHYKAKFVPKCAACNDYITEDCVRALDRSWHSHHFGCGGCGLNFSSHDIGYHENEGQAYCETCYTNMVLPKCQGCQKPITDRTMKAMGGQWHVTCFVCKVRPICMNAYNFQSKQMSTNYGPIKWSLAFMENQVCISLMMLWP